MSAERELLELAAKAAGIKIGNWLEFQHTAGFASDAKVEPWNPLTDDGDALRLAVKLGLIVGSYDNFASVCLVGVDEDTLCWHHETQGDRYAAIRRAIVRAAAEIGKATP